MAMRLALFLLTLAAALTLPASADVPVPSPTQFTFSGLSKAPQYAFFYTTEKEGTNLQLVEQGQMYEANADVLVFIRDRSKPAQQFATLKHEYRGLQYIVEVRGVTAGKDGMLTVDNIISKGSPKRGAPRVRPNEQPQPGTPAPFRTSTPPPSKRRGEASPVRGAAGYFLLAGLSLGGLVLARRRLE
jgi:hypothetical protein